MANIKKLQMWNDICADARIGISKSMLGLKTTAVYVPTQSVIDARTIEYTPQDGQGHRRVPAQGSSQWQLSAGGMPVA